MAHIQFVDELVKEYLLFRGFTTTLKAFDNDLKADKDKGFRVDKIVDQLLSHLNASDLNGLKDYWAHLDSFVFSKLEIHFQPAVRKLEYSLYKLYLVTAIQGTGGAKGERVSEFFARMLPELQGQSEWRDWFVLPYIVKPEENPTFSLYFTRGWQESVLASLHNLLATALQCMPQPTLASLYDDLPNRTKSAQPTADRGGAVRLTAPAPLVDDFSAAGGAAAGGGDGAPRTLRQLIRQVGASPQPAKTLRH